MRYSILHETEYRYSSSAALSMNDACIFVRETPCQRVISSSLVTDPAADYQRDRLDWFGNLWRLCAFERPHDRLVLSSSHQVEVLRRPGEALGSESGWEPYLYGSPFVRLSEEFADYGRPSFSPGSDPVDSLLDLTNRIFADFTYSPNATMIGTPVEEFFKKRHGVCQDYAHLTIAVLRSLGIPARYVSGYLNTLPPPGKEKVLGADASHAWVSAWVAGRGWVDLDPTNGVAVGDAHITVAWGRDYGDVTPLRGVVLGGGVQHLEVRVTVLPL